MYTTDMLVDKRDIRMEVNGASVSEEEIKNFVDGKDTVEGEVSLDSGADEVIAKSAFDPANFTEVMLIMQMRLYDLNLALLSAIDPEKAAALIDMHSRGQSFAPPPVFAEYEDDDDTV